METEIRRDLVYLGWTTQLTGGDFVNLMLDEDVILAATKGEIFCLRAESGDILWQNQLPGMGFGLISIATANGNTGTSPAVAKRRQDEAATAVSTAAIVAST